MELIAKKRLEAVLASYGADPGRWPVADRAALAAHLPEAGSLVAEARQIDAWLDLATVPAMALDFQTRLLVRARNGSAPANVIPLRPPARSQRPLHWLAAVPLAASLVLGIYLGAAGSIDSLLPSAVTGTVASSDEDSGDLSGVTDVTDYRQDKLS